MHCMCMLKYLVLLPIETRNYTAPTHITAYTIVNKWQGELGLVSLVQVNKRV